MFNKVVYLNNAQNNLMVKEKETLDQTEFYQYVFSGEFIDKVSFYNIQNFDKKSKSLIRLY